MPPRRRRTASKPAAAASRVHRIATRQAWDNMQRKAGGRVVVVQFYQASVHVCNQMRPFFVQLSKTFVHKRKVIFAEVELEECPELGSLAGVQRVPTYQCWFNGEMKSSYSGGMPTKVQALAEEAVAQYCSGGGGLARTLLTALAVAGVAAAGVFAFKRLGGGGGGGDDGDELADVARKLTTAYDRLRAYERANRVKGALAQRKLIERLEARQRALERSRGARQQQAAKAAAAAKASSKSAEQEDEDVGYYTDEEVAAQGQGGAGAGGQVVYSDEEEE